MQACVNFNNNGTCVTECPPRKVYNPDTEQFENNDDFRFHSGSLCVDTCPSKYSIQYSKPMIVIILYHRWSF